MSAELKRIHSPDIDNFSSYFDAKNLAKHKLGGVLDSFGGDSIAAFRAIETSAQNLANSGAIAGIFKTSVKIGGQSVTVRG